jgi:copper resistance protein C
MAQLRRVGWLTLIIVVWGLTAAAPASAHAHLSAMQPAVDATVSTPPGAVVLSFDEAVHTSFAVVTVTGPDGRRLDLGAPSVIDGTVTEGVAPLPGSGRYTVAYRVVSADGHPVSAQEHFTFAAPADYQPAATTTDPAVPSSASAPAGSAARRHAGHLGQVGVVAAVLTGAMVMLLRDRRKKT